MVCYVLKFVNSIIRFVNTLPVDQRCYLTVVQKMLPFLLGHPVDQTVWIGHFTRIETSNFLVYLENKNWGKLAKIPSFLPWRNHNNMFSTIFFNFLSFQLLQQLVILLEIKLYTFHYHCITVRTRKLF